MSVLGRIGGKGSGAYLNSSQYAEFIRRYRLYDELLEVLKMCESAMDTANEHCYSDGTVHHQSFDTIALGEAQLKARTIISKATEKPKDPKPK